MKYLKTLGLAAIAATALLALGGVGTASATTLTGVGGAILPAETEIHGPSEGKVVLHTAIGKMECDSTIKMKTQNEGGAGLVVFAGVESLPWNNCVAGVAETLTTGLAVIKGIGGNNGELTSSGFELTIEKAGFHCVYKTNNTKVGTVTGTATTGATATIDVSSVVPRSGGRSGAFCGSTGTWTGAYKINTPDVLNVDV